jgi:hypothetical protein
MRFIHTTRIIGSGRSIADPIRPALVDMMPNTPKAIIWSTDLRECVIVAPDTIPAADRANIDAEARAGRARWLSDAEFDSWLQQKIGARLQQVLQRVGKTRFFSLQEVRGSLLVLKGAGLRELADVGGLRFYARQEKVG